MYRVMFVYCTQKGVRSLLKGDVKLSWAILCSEKCVITVGIWHISLDLANPLPSGVCIIIV